jgi:hypothetical protein
MITVRVTKNRWPQVLDMLDRLDTLLLDPIADKAVGYVADLAPKRTGKGAASYHKEVVGPGARIITNEPDTAYMLFVELGTHKMRAQPHAVPGVLKAADEVEALFNSLVAAAIG